MASPFDAYYQALNKWKGYLLDKSCPDAPERLDKCAETFAVAIGGLEKEISEQLDCFGNIYTQPWAIGMMIETVIESYFYLGMISTIHELKGPEKELAQNYFSHIRIHMEKAKYLKPN